MLSKRQHPRFRDRSNERFGRLLVIRLDRFEDNRSYWFCRCDCGTRVVLSLSCLLSGQQSCGCLKHETKPSLIHGDASYRNGRALEYNTWLRMNQRCSNPNDKNFADYGGRGIKVCKPWRDSYETFIADMGRRPTPQHSIDRIDNDGNYTPANCRWATKSEQRNNQRKGDE